MHLIRILKMYALVLLQIPLSVLVMGLVLAALGEILLAANFYRPNVNIFGFPGHSAQDLTGFSRNISLPSWGVISNVSLEISVIPSAKKIVTIIKSMKFWSAFLTETVSQGTMSSVNSSLLASVNAQAHTLLQHFSKGNPSLLIPYDSVMTTLH